MLASKNHSPAHQHFLLIFPDLLLNGSSKSTLLEHEKSEKKSSEMTTYMPKAVGLSQLPGDQEQHGQCIDCITLVASPSDLPYK
jgi:hypothetical protein